jgi:hypothetical protein
LSNVDPPSPGRRSRAIGALRSTFGTNAFTASNTGGVSKAGAGSGAISGYSVSNVAYTTSGGDITAVGFNLDSAAGNVTVQLSTAGTQYACGATAPVTFRVTCATAEPIAGADSLAVVASQ